MFLSATIAVQLRADLEQLKQARETEQDRLQRWATQLDARHMQIAREADEAAAVRYAGHMGGGWSGGRDGACNTQIIVCDRSFVPTQQTNLGINLCDYLRCRF